MSSIIGGRVAGAAPAAAAPRRAPAAPHASAAPAPRAPAPAAEPAPAATGAAASRRVLLSGSLALAAAAATAAPAPPAAAASRLLSSDWELVELPIDKGVVLLDVGFTGSDPLHGFLLGTRQTLLETFDGGKTWAPRSIEAAAEEGFNYRFTSISFAGDEGWIVGKPAILLHTTNGGKAWERVPLSAKLPGTPQLVTALAGPPGAAEMTTDQGAIYVTANGGNNWTAAVQETVDATLNRVISSGISGASYYEGSFSQIARSPATGAYVAVSSRGNFYMTWAPGQAFWQPHNRQSTRRLQNMGFAPGPGADGDAEERLWLTTKGGGLFLARGAAPAVGEPPFDEARIGSRGLGILDVKFAGGGLGYACGGSGSLYKTLDGGATWKRDRSTDDLAANLYEIKFGAGGATGFVLGNDAVLLRWTGNRGAMA